MANKTLANCPLCDSEHVSEQVFSEKLVRENKSHEIAGLRHFVCTNCEGVFTDEEQSRHNLATTQRALGETPRYVSPRQIRDWRESTHLTQRVAARVLGGGVNAFSKYETGEVVQSDSMDNLLWLSMQYPGVVPTLAIRKGIALSQDALIACGFLVQVSATTLAQMWTYSGPIGAQGFLARVSLGAIKSFSFSHGIVWKTANDSLFYANKPTAA